MSYPVVQHAERAAVRVLRAVRDFIEVRLDIGWCVEAGEQLALSPGQVCLEFL